MFPQGGPGIALLLFRFSVAGIFLYEFWTHFAPRVSQWASLIVFVVALCVGIGIFTPLLAVLICLADIYYLTQAGSGDAAIHIAAILNAVALAFLGPGAYSVDARLYGRRVVVVPAPKHPED
jgi:uncharacterized membrane protein YphA (DoxX/SURF4 family)